MSIHKIFAENLRTQCMRVGTIAEVCRNASVNRQQFNRYLSGAAIPNAGTLSRICKALNIGETELFKSPEAGSQPDTRSKQLGEGLPLPQNDPTEFLETVVQSFDPDIIRAMRNRKSSLPEAIYNCYFPLQNMNTFLVRSILSVKNIGGITHFRRYTRLKSPSVATSDIALGKHFGIVYPDAYHYYFVGINKFTPHNISLLAVQQRNWSQGNLSIGLALMQGTRDPFASCICIEKLGNSTSIAKQALKRAGIVSLDDRTVNPIVASIYRPRSTSPAKQLSVPSLDEALVSAFKPEEPADG